MTETARKIRIWHLSADFPDSIDEHKTTVIRDLVNLTSDRLDHFVVSMNRVSPSITDAIGVTSDVTGARSVRSWTEFENGIALQYLAPAKGVMHETMLRRFAASLVFRLRDEPKPDLVIGHKLTVEGIVAELLAKAMRVPYALSIQGDTDTKILRARPDLGSTYRRIFHNARIVFPFAPWALARVEDKLGKRESKTVILPCCTKLDEPMPTKVPGDSFVSVFHLKNFRRKNLIGMVQAMSLLEQANVDTCLEIIGGGSQADLASCSRITKGKPRTTLVGPLESNALRDRLNSAKGFVLPSLRESFGLVFIEALFAGLPIIYPRGQALSGYMDDMPFALSVDPRNPGEIAQAMRHVIENEAPLKLALDKWLGSTDAVRFQRPSISNQFCNAISETVSQPSG